MLCSAQSTAIRRDQRLVQNLGCSIINPVEGITINIKEGECMKQSLTCLLSKLGGGEVENESDER